MLLLGILLASPWGVVLGYLPSRFMQQQITILSHAYINLSEGLARASIG